MRVPTIQEAHDIGATGGTVSDEERLAFEAYMKGHCWALDATWNGEYYVGSMMTRMLWAVWRDRAALAAIQSTVDN